MAKQGPQNAPEVEVRSLAQLRDWLAAHHRRADGVWLVHPKKASPEYIAMTDIVDELLCWGWIDSLPRARDDLQTMHYIAPRDARANWSRVNKEKVAALMAAGRMRPAGTRTVQLAKETGTWSALDDVENGVIPPDLRKALDAAGLRADWDALARSVRRGALEILLNAKREATRASKIAQIIDALAAGDRPFRWVGKS